VNFAENGFRVIGVNRTPEKVSALNNGACYLTDLDLDERVANVVRRKQLSATTDPVEAALYEKVAR